MDLQSAIRSDLAMMTASRIPNYCIVIRKSRNYWHECRTKIGAQLFQGPATAAPRTA